MGRKTRLDGHEDPSDDVGEDADEVGRGGLDKSTMMYLPIAAKPKARPSVTKNGTYMPEDYTDWQEAMGWALKEKGVKGDDYPGSVRMELICTPHGMWVEMKPTAVIRPKGIGGDIDNLAGGVLDAFQEHHIFKNDSQVTEMVVRMEE